MVQRLLSEAKYAIRSLARAPGFTIVAVATLAIGIGANTAIFSVVNGVLLQPLPFEEADQLVNVSHTAPGLNYEQFPLSHDTYQLIRDQNDVFAEMGLYNQGSVNLTGEGEPMRATALIGTRELASTLGLTFAAGRGFTEEEDRPEGPQVVILGYELWETRYGADPGVVGTSIYIDGTPREVVGVLPADFDLLGTGVSLWLPLAMDPANPPVGTFGMSSIGRLKPGVTAEVAQASLAPLIDRLIEQNGASDTYVAFIRTGRLSILVDPLKEQIVGDLQRPLWILLGTVGFVLLIACANVANLVLVRAEARQKEIAVRSALGAGRSRILGHFLAESTILAALGGAGGIALAYAGLRALLVLAPIQLPRSAEVSLGFPVLAFTAGLTLVVAVIFGTAPALRSFGAGSGSLRSDRGSTVGRERHRVRNLLVAGQTAMALVLLVGSGLMLRSFDQLRNIDPGFDAEGVLVFQVNLPREAYEGARAAADFQQELIDRLGALPGVTGASAATYVPLSGGGSGTAIRAEDQPLNPDELPPMLWYKTAAPGYFETMGIELVAGRTLNRMDHQDALPNVVINRGTAERLWPGQDALGKRLGQNNADTAAVWYTVVGVVEDVADMTLQDDRRELVYYSMVTPLGDEGPVARSMTFVVRTAGSPTALSRPARAAVWAMNPDLPVQDIQTMESIVAESTARLSFTMVALAISAIVALLLGGIGLYGVLSYVVNQRTREMGVRIALGAEAGQVRWMVVRQGMVVAGAGLAVGVGASLYLARVLESLLYGTNPNDLVTFVTTSGVLLAVALFASYLPARRASSIDPMEALRSE